jgi:hypothetical protein
MLVVNWTPEGKVTRTKKMRSMPVVQHGSIASTSANSEDSTDHLVRSNLSGRREDLGLWFLSPDFLGCRLDLMLPPLNLRSLLWRILRTLTTDAVTRTCW